MISKNGVEMCKTIQNCPIFFTNAVHEPCTDFFLSVMNFGVQDFKRSLDFCSINISLNMMCLMIFVFLSCDNPLTPV